MARLRRIGWFCCVFLLAACCGLRAETVAGLPAQPEHHVEDFAGILSPETTQNIEDLLTQLNLKAHARIEVVTLKSMDADKSGAQPSIEQFATALEDKWKVGEKGTDRGLLLIVSLNPRKYRIEVGYGLEGILNDAKVGDIGRDMQPYLHNGNYDQALSLGANELAQDIAADAHVTLNATAQVPQRIAIEDQPQVHISIVPALLFGVFVIIVLGALIRSGHAGLLFFLLFNILGGGRGGGGYGGGGGDWGGGGGGGGGDSGVGFGGGSGGGGASGDF
jgi:uncharacterized protein